MFSEDDIKRLCIRIGHYGAIQMLYYYYYYIVSLVKEMSSALIVLD